MQIIILLNYFLPRFVLSKELMFSLLFIDFDTCTMKNNAKPDSFYYSIKFLKYNLIYLSFEKLHSAKVSHWYF